MTVAREAIVRALHAPATVTRTHKSVRSVKCVIHSRTQPVGARRITALDAVNATRVPLASL